MPIGKFSKYLIKRVNEIVDESLMHAEREYESALQGLRYLRNVYELPLASPMVDDKKREDLIGRYFVLMFRMSESLFLLDDALLLALSGRYTSALSILRSAIESITLGAFYHGLTISSLRQKISSHMNNKPPNSSKTYSEIISEAISKTPEIVESGLALEMKIRSELKRHSPPLKPPSFSRTLGDVIDMFYLHPLKKPYGAFIQVSIKHYVHIHMSNRKQPPLGQKMERGQSSSIVARLACKE